MAATRFNWYSSGYAVAVPCLRDIRLLQLCEEERIDLPVQHQGMLFVLDGLGELKTESSSGQRRSSVRAQQLFSLEPGTTARVRCVRPLLLLFADAALYRASSSGMEPLLTEPLPLSFPFCMHIPPHDTMDYLLHQITEELERKNFGYLPTVQSLLPALWQLWHRSEQQIFNSFWNTIDALRISGSFPDREQTLSFSSLEILSGAPNHPQTVLGRFPPESGTPLVYCQKRVTAVPDAAETAFRIRGGFTLAFPFPEGQEPLDLSAFRETGLLRLRLCASAACRLEVSLYSQSLQEGTQHTLDYTTPGVPYEATLRIGSDRSHSLSWPVQQARAYMERHYGEHLRISQIADALHINAGYLSTIFRRQTGQTLSSYLQQLRLQKAAELLQSTELPVKEIARQLGFCDIQHLSRLFLETYHMRPLAYRQSFRTLR